MHNCQTRSTERPQWAIVPPLCGLVFYNPCHPCLSVSHSVLTDSPMTDVTENKLFSMQHHLVYSHDILSPLRDCYIYVYIHTLVTMFVHISLFGLLWHARVFSLWFTL